MELQYVSELEKRGLQVKDLPEDVGDNKIACFVDNACVMPAIWYS